MRLTEKREMLMELGENLMNKGGKLTLNFTNGSMRYTELTASRQYHYQSDKRYVEISAMVHFREPNVYKVIPIDTNTINFVLETLLSNSK